jgi:putative Mg2+ transporter-C (MgtC) family protein
VISNQQIALRLIVSAALGSLIGLERSRREGGPGLRTHMLVCVGSTLFMVVSAFGFGDVLGTPNVTLDPSRIAAQVVSGIGFLGAGAIIMRREIVHGLTTAAGVWAVAAVGLAVGGGLYLAAIMATGMMLVILAVIKPLETKFFSRRRGLVINVTGDLQEAVLASIESVLRLSGLRLRRLVVHRGEGSGDDHVEITVFRSRDEDQSKIAEIEATLTAKVREIEGVREVTFAGPEGG